MYTTLTLIMMEIKIIKYCGKEMNFCSLDLCDYKYFEEIREELVLMGFYSKNPYPKFKTEIKSITTS